jgi:hypothetical protein
MQIRATSLTLGVTVGALALWQASGPAAHATGSVAQDTTPVLSPSVPGDVAANPTQADVVAFAWRSFVAINWPALAGARGVPDTSKRIGQPGVVVWNTWKAPEEIFLPQAQPPRPWNQYGGSLPAVCTKAGARPNEFAIRRISKVPGGSHSPVLQNMKQVVGGSLTDQHGNLARYEVRVNQTIFNAIVAKQYYNRTIQDQARNISLPYAGMEVKAAWREMTPADSPAVRARFFRQDAWIYTPPTDSQPATCVKGELGLVGLHVTQKTPSRPQWVWATFEQVDNVPPFGSSGPVPGRTLPYSFNNPACPPTTCWPDSSTEKPPGHPTTVPTQVTRRVNLGSAAQGANPAWQQALAQAAPGSPFAFYELVDVQSQPSTYAPPTPYLLANTVLETYVNQSSCLNCHFVARTASGKLSADYSYILAEAQSPPIPVHRGAP